MQASLTFESLCVGVAQHASIMLVNQNWLKKKNNSFHFFHYRLLILFQNSYRWFVAEASAGNRSYIFLYIFATKYQLCPVQATTPHTSPFPHFPFSSTNGILLLAQAWGGFKMKKPIYEPTILDHVAGVHETHLEFRRETPEVEKMCSQVQLLLMVSFSFMVMMEVSGAPRKHTPTELLPADPIKNKVSTLNVYNRSHCFTRVFLF